MKKRLLIEGDMWYSVTRKGWKTHILGTISCWVCPSGGGPDSPVTYLPKNWVFA